MVERSEQKNVEKSLISIGIIKFFRLLSVYTCIATEVIKY